MRRNSKATKNGTKTRCLSATRGGELNSARTARGAATALDRLGLLDKNCPSASEPLFHKPPEIVEIFNQKQGDIVEIGSALAESWDDRLRRIIRAKNLGLRLGMVGQLKRIHLTGSISDYGMFVVRAGNENTSPGYKTFAFTPHKNSEKIIVKIMLLL